MKDKSRRIVMRPWAEVVVDDIYQWMKFATLFEKERMSYKWTDYGADRSGRRWAFRGQADAEWDISSTLERATFKRYFKEDDRREVEKQSIDEFVRRSSHFLRGCNMTPFDRVALMQHYGAPTRLVDFTFSPYVALYFAAPSPISKEEKKMLGEKFEDHGFTVWAICLDELHEHPDFPEEEIADVRPGRVCEREFRPRVYNNDAKDLFGEEGFGESPPPICIAYPKFGNERSNAQSGLFLLQSRVEKNFMDDLASCMNCKQEAPVWLGELCHRIPYKDCRNDLIGFSRLIKFKFNKDLRQEAVLALRAMNLLPHTLFPDLAGVGESVLQSVEDQVDDFSWLSE